MVELDFLAKMPSLRLMFLVIVAAAGLEAFLYAQGGQLDRVDDSIVGGLILVVAVGLLNAVSRSPAGDERLDLVALIVALYFAITGFSLMMGYGFWPWDWMFTWLPWL